MMMKNMIIGLLILLFTTPAIAIEKKVKLVASEFPPYYGKNLPNQGFVTEIARNAFKKFGYKLEMEFIPFARALRYAKQGKSDGILGIWHSREREQWFAFSHQLAPNLMGFYKRKDKKISFQTYADLKPYEIGTVLGYVNPPGFDKADLFTQAVVTDEQNILKLNSKRIDIALMDKDVGLHIMRMKYPKYIDVLEWLEPPIKVSYLYIGFSKKTKDYERLLKDFDLGLIRLTEEGGVNKIRDKHGY